MFVLKSVLGSYDGFGVRLESYCWCYCFDVCFRGCVNWIKKDVYEVMWWIVEDVIFVVYVIFLMFKSRWVNYSCVKVFLFLMCEEGVKR